MSDKRDAQKKLDNRGPRWAIWIELDRNSAQVIYADTADHAEKIHEHHLDQRSRNQQRVQLHPPTGSVTLGEAADEREGAKSVFDEKTAILKAVVLQALDEGRAEAEVAREARVDRMTVRSWAGKR